MPATVIFTGLASGALLAAAGLGLWDGLRRVPGLTRAVQVIRWLAGTLLATGALLAWQEGHSLSAPAPRLILMAALAAPPGTYRRHLPRWSAVWPTLPALALAGAGLLRASESTQAQLGGPPVAVVELAVVICGGLGARALGEALNEIATSALHVDWPSAVTYALLTLVVGGTALVNLWQRGSAWAGTAGASGLAGAWLSWSAARIGPRRPPRLRAVLIALAASFLIALAALDRPFRSQMWFG